MNAKDSSITMLRQFFPMITFQKTTSVQKPQPGAVKEKVLERKRGSLFDLFAVDIIAILKYAAPDGSMS